MSKEILTVGDIEIEKEKRNYCGKNLIVNLSIIFFF